MVNNQKHIFHLIPPGILHPDKTCLFVNGVVIDPGVPHQRDQSPAEQGLAVNPGNLVVSASAIDHALSPPLDAARDKRKGEDQIGTTGGASVLYEDKGAVPASASTTCSQHGLHRKAAPYSRGKVLPVRAFFTNHPSPAAIEENIWPTRALAPYVESVSNSVQNGSSRGLHSRRSGTISILITAPTVRYSSYTVSGKPAVCGNRSHPHSPRVWRGKPKNTRGGSVPSRRNGG